MTIELSEEEDKSEYVNKVKDYKSKIMKTSKQIEDTYFFIQKIKQQLLRLENGQKQIAGKDNIFSLIKKDIDSLNYKNNEKKILKNKKNIKNKKLIINQFFHNSEKKLDRVEKPDKNHFLGKKHYNSYPNIFICRKDNKNEREVKNQKNTKSRILDNNLININHKIYFKVDKISNNKRKHFLFLTKSSDAENTKYFKIFN